jgi:hypothetical protein
VSRRLGNSVVVQQAIRMHEQSGFTARQNNSRIIRPSHTQVAELVREVVEVGPTTEDLQRFIDIISREVDDPGLEYAQVETEIREHTPFVGVLRFLSSSQNRIELASYLGLLLVIVQTWLVLVQKPVMAPTPEQVEEIIERVIERVESGSPSQPEPPATTESDCGNLSGSGAR